jgi:rhodanese-related sulfurtransferase
MSPTDVMAAEEAKMPVRFHTIVDLKFVEEYAVIPRREDAMIVDSRPKGRKYDKGHIPTAVSIPHREFDKHMALLPTDKGKLMIFYCGGVKCPLSHKSAFKAEGMGYTNVKVFSEGYPAWIKAGHVGAVSTSYVKKLVDTKANVAIIDARPKARKYDKGHVPTAISIPFREFDKHIGMLPADKATPLIFYCGGFKCTLSVKSANKAMALGYTNVKIYPAGYPAWKKAMKANVSKSGISAGKEQGTISINSFSTIMKEKPDSIMVVDVRDAVEFKAGSFRTAVNIPIDNLEKQVATLPSDKPIVFICNSGGLAGEAYDITMLLRKGLEAYFLEAEVTFNKDGSYAIKPIAG